MAGKPAAGELISLEYQCVRALRLRVKQEACSFRSVTSRLKRSNAVAAAAAAGHGE